MVRPLLFILGRSVVAGNVSCSANWLWSSRSSFSINSLSPGWIHTTYGENITFNFRCPPLAKTKLFLSIFYGLFDKSFLPRESSQSGTTFPDHCPCSRLTEGTVCGFTQCWCQSRELQKWEDTSCVIPLQSDTFNSSFILPSRPQTSRPIVSSAEGLQCDCLLCYHERINWSVGRLCPGGSI